ncbi:hypothetical protein O3G_MSEX003584 [Manduca sexta]|uniref:Uncharacterized protein n=1 Tax=Manduca sexta TaxID=7130 RepID=A0A921YT99_MANSE|nr:hypothetical protein O3G_MSEX003584 [Manduca sexta]
MLSVQVPGCAGMERLGAPGGPRLRHDHRHHHSTLEWEKQQTLQAMVGRLQEMVEQETRARSAAAAERLGLPPSIQLPDGEYGQDAHLQLRVPYQVCTHHLPYFTLFVQKNCEPSDSAALTFQSRMLLVLNAVVTY